MMRILLKCTRRPQVEDEVEEDEVEVAEVGEVEVVLLQSVEMDIKMEWSFVILEVLDEKLKMVNSFFMEGITILLIVVHFVQVNVLFRGKV